MPLARFVLVVVLVILAAAVTVWVGAFWTAAVQYPRAGTLVAIPVALFAYVIVRVVWDRARSAGDKHYDRIEK